MRALVAVAVVATLLAVALALRAPATLIDGRIDDLTGGRVRVANAAGTVLNGSGDLILAPTGAGLHVSWHIDALPLLRGALRGSLGVEGASLADFDLEHDRDELRNLALTLPADALARAVGAPAMIADAPGSVEVHVEHLVRQRNTIDGSIELRWLGASLPGPRPDARIALGDVRVACTGAGAELPGTIANSGGDVDIAGSVALAANGTARVDARIRPRDAIDPERARAIAAVLAALGIPDGSGGYRITGTYAL